MELEPMRIFVKVIQLASFSRAAELLKLPKATVSRSVARLEEELGVKLIVRTTRSLKATDAGLLFYESCQAPIQALEDAHKTLKGQDSSISGTVRITAPVDFGERVVAPVIGNLAKLYPGLLFELNCTDSVVDLVREGYDLALRVGKLAPSQFKARKLGNIAHVVVASPSYLKTSQPIQTPQDLIDHTCLTYSRHSLSTHWTLHHDNGESAVVNVKPKIAVNALKGLLSVTVQGVGVALLPWFVCKDDMLKGNLVCVLPEWIGNAQPISLVSPGGTATAKRIKIVADELAHAVQEAIRV
jgi:DNA-binding transcriptional LysR family regulator